MKLFLGMLSAKLWAPFHDMQECIALEELYLSHNGIAKMESLSTLINLRVLDVASNKLTQINGIENLTKYEKMGLIKSCIILLYFASTCTCSYLILVMGVQVRRSLA